MDAINRTGVDRFLNAIGAVAVLSNCSGATEMRLNNKRIACNVGAVAATDANRFIHPDSLISHVTPQQGFSPGGLLLRPSGCGKGVRR